MLPNGEYWDSETQTYYLRARHFNPRTGRFTQPDPHWGIHNMMSDAASIIQSGNLYMFTMHNPVMFTDPSGRFAVLSAIANTISNALSSLSSGSSSASPPLSQMSGTTSTGALAPVVRPAAERMLPKMPVVKDRILPLVPPTILRMLGVDANVGQQGGGTVMVGGEIVAGLNIPGELERIARGFGNYECDLAADAMALALAAAGLTPQYAEIWFSGAPGASVLAPNQVRTMSGGIFPPGTVISDTGWHVGIYYNGMIFCNVHPGGLSDTAWVNDFYGEGTRTHMINRTMLGPVFWWR